MKRRTPILVFLVFLFHFYFLYVGVSFGISFFSDHKNGKIRGKFFLSFLFFPLFQFVFLVVANHWSCVAKKEGAIIRLAKGKPLWEAHWCESIGDTGELTGGDRNVRLSSAGAVWPPAGAPAARSTSDPPVWENAIRERKNRQQGQQIALTPARTGQPIHSKLTVIFIINFLRCRRSQRHTTHSASLQRLAVRVLAHSCEGAGAQLCVYCTTHTALVYRSLANCSQCAPQIAGELQPVCTTDRWRTAASVHHRSLAKSSNNSAPIAN